MKLLIALYLYANGSFQLVIGNSVGIHVYHKSDHSSSDICNYFNEWVHINTDRVHVDWQKRTFKSIAGFHNMILNYIITNLIITIEIMFTITPTENEEM